MNQEKQVPVRGGGVVIAKKIVKTRQVLDKNGNVVEETVEKPDEQQKMRPMRRGITTRSR